MTHEAINNRVLIVDDNVAIHEDIRKVLCPPLGIDAQTIADDAFLFGDDAVAATTWVPPEYKLTSVYQGKHALEQVVASMESQLPIAVAIIDMRMPPGWNGLETVKKIWQIDPKVLIIFCTAFSDFGWQEMSSELGYSDRFIILKKPFDNAELQQLVAAMTRRWGAERQAEANLDELARLTIDRHRLESQIRDLKAELDFERKRNSRSLSRGSDGLNILICDDRQDEASETRQALAGGGANVELLESPEDLLNECLMSKALGQSIDAVVVEVALLQGDGYDTVRRLRAAGFAGQIVAYTNHERPADAIACCNAGCDLWLRKSDGPAALVSVVTNSKHVLQGS